MNIIRLYPFLMLVAFISILFTGCATKNNKSATHTVQVNTPAKSEERIAATNLLQTEQLAGGVTYSKDTLKTKAALMAFKERYSTEQLQVIMAFNRLDPNRLRTNIQLIIPDTVLATFDSYSPFPNQLQAGQNIPKLFVVNQRIQLFAAYENGNLVRFGPVSTGKKATPTPNGLYHTNYKKKSKVSTVDGDWVMPWYTNIHNTEGIALHQYALPGYPASHSCVRLYEKDAMWVYNWADGWQLSDNGQKVLKNGTPVLIFGKFDFDQPASWKELPTNPKIMELNAEEQQTLNEALNKIIGEQPS